MRYVDRSGVLPPKSLVDATGAGPQERKRAVKHYAAPSAAPFKFKAYKGADVITALEQLFHRKCAYCESRYGATQPADIEHYRPKLAVYGATDHPGYWWLAAEWTNLLPSCIDCNRRRYHERYDSEDVTITADQVRELAGKKDFFPVFGTWRAFTPFDILKYEIALLIDPTRRNPDAHFTWDTVVSKGRKLSLVFPRIENKVKDRHALTSIKVLGLNRSGLVGERTLLIERLECDYRGLQESIRMGAHLPSDELPTFLPNLRERLDRFLDEKNPDKEYSACAGKFVDEMAGKLLCDLEALQEKVAHLGT